jgi:hypothetical protein
VNSLIKPLISNSGLYFEPIQFTLTSENLNFPQKFSFRSDAKSLDVVTYLVVDISILYLNKPKVNYTLIWGDKVHTSQIYSGSNFDELLDAIPEEYDDYLVLFKSPEFNAQLKDTLKDSLSPFAKLKKIEEIDASNSYTFQVTCDSKEGEIFIDLVYDKDEEVWGFGKFISDFIFPRGLSSDFKKALPPGVSANTAISESFEVLSGLNITPLLAFDSYSDALVFLKRIMKVYKKYFKKES